MEARALARTTARGLCFGALAISAACAPSGSLSPASPSPPVAWPSMSVTLTVRVHARGTEAPIAGALVRHESSGSFTDAAGESQFSLASGREVTIDVSAAGYHPMQASAVLNSDERWTFFLETRIPS